MANNNLLYYKYLLAQIRNINSQIKVLEEHKQYLSEELATANLSREDYDELFRMAKKDQGTTPANPIEGVC